MTDNRLKSLAERIERLMDERDGIQSDIREIYVEAKSAGYVPKVLRKAITRKRMDPDKRSEEDTILDLYEDALSPTMRKVVAMAKAGANSRDIEAATGVDHATVARSVALKKESATGEITTARLDTPPGGSGDLIEGHSAAPASDACVARFAPHLDEPRETATQQETTHEREGSDGADEGPRGHDAADGDRPVWTVSSNSGPDEGEAGEERHSDGRCDAGRGDKAGEQVTSGAVAEAQPERVARQPSSSAWREIAACREALEAERKAARDAERERRRAAHAAWVKKNAEIDADPLTPPAFLDRRQRASA